MPADDAECSACGQPLQRRRGVIELDLEAPNNSTPLPVDKARLLHCLDELDRGTAFRPALEALLLSEPIDVAERLMQLLREGRGAWLPLLSTCNGEALLLGNAFSGLAVALARLGFRVTLIERDSDRLAFAVHRDRALARGDLRAVASSSERLPFPDQSFDLVVREGGLPEAGSASAVDLVECRRVCAGELVLIADNRYGYKVSSGKRADFRVPGTLEYLRGILRADARRSLAGYGAELVDGNFQKSRSLALYPHSRDFAHVVDLSNRAPRLYLGPRERENKLKLWGYRLGFFPLLTPSFALVAARKAQPARARIEKLLDQVQERCGEERGELDELWATRGNNALIYTRSGKPKRSGNDEYSDDLPGAWAVHIPLCPKQDLQVLHHPTQTKWIRANFPHLKVPKALFHGTIDGIVVSAERRLPGFSAAQYSGQRAVMSQLLPAVAGDLAQLVTRPAQPFTQAEFERLVGTRIDRVAHHCGLESTRTALGRLRDRMGETLIGAPMPLVYAHNDLRSKHIQIDPEGHILGYLDFGAGASDDLPYHDLLHLIVHERKQRDGGLAGAAWRKLAGAPASGGEHRLDDHEQGALEAYVQALGLEPKIARALEALYPVLVGSMAESHWDYSRPRWFHRSFEV